MSEGGTRISRPGPRALAFAAYGVLALGAAFHFADEIDTDGVAYLRIAGYYAAGDLGRAVSAYWSPLYSWLLVPGLALGVPPLLTAKLLGAAIALGWVHAVGLLARRFVDSSVARALLCVAAAAQGLAWSMQTIGADLLLGVLLTYYFHVMSDPALLTRPRRVFAGGLLGGLAYLAKAYALPFFLAHFVLTLALAARGPVSRTGAARGGRGGWPGRAAVAGLLGFGLLAAPWVAVLSEAQGRFTFSTALARNRPVVGDANAFLPFALRIPPEQRLVRLEPGRLTTWETLDRFQPALLTETPATDPWIVLRGRLREAGENLAKVRNHLSSFDGFHLAIPCILGALFLAWRARRREPGAADPSVWAALTVALYGAGYLPLVATQQRYFWPAAGLLLVIAGGTAEKFAAATLGRAERSLATARLALAPVAIVAASFLLVAVHGLVMLAVTPRPEYRSLARHVNEVARKSGTTAEGPIAGNDWTRTLYTAFAMNAPMAGITMSREPATLAQEMRLAGVRLFLVFDDRTLSAELRRSAAFRFLGDVTQRGAPGTVVATFELPG